MKLSLIKLTILLVAAALATTSFAEKDGKSAGFWGKVSAMAEGTITVSNKKKGDQTFKTDAETKIVKLDGSAGAIGDLKVGSMVKVVAGATAGQATEIKLVEIKKKGEGKTETPSKE